MKRYPDRVKPKYINKFKKVWTKKLDDLMCFGKYRKLRVQFCIEMHPDYCVWAIDAGYLQLNYEAEEVLNAVIEISKGNNDIGTKVHHTYHNRTEDVYDRITRYGRPVREEPPEPRHRRKISCDGFNSY